MRGRQRYERELTEAATVGRAGIAENDGTNRVSQKTKYSRIFKRARKSLTLENAGDFLGLFAVWILGKKEEEGKIEFEKERKKKTAV